MSNANGVSAQALLDMITDIAPQLVARGRVTVHVYGWDCSLRLNGVMLMTLHLDVGNGWLCNELRKVFACAQ